MKVLISCDHSAAGEHILVEAEKLLTNFEKPEIHLFSVIDIALVSSAGMYNNTDALKTMEDEAKEINLWAQKIFRNGTIHFSHEVGYPAEMILRKATNMQAELLIIGTHGKTGLSRMLVGSVAESVLRSTPCNTLVIPVKHIKNGRHSPD